MHTTGVICVELVRKLQDAGARFTEVGVHHYRRVHGTSEFFRVGAIAAHAAATWRGLWVQMVVLRRGRTSSGQRVASTMTDVPTGTSWCASHRRSRSRERREHAVEGALVDVGPGAVRRGAASQPVDHAERRGRWREERVGVGAPLHREAGGGGELARARPGGSGAVRARWRRGHAGVTGERGLHQQDRTAAAGHPRAARAARRRRRARCTAP